MNSSNTTLVLVSDNSYTRAMAEYVLEGILLLIAGLFGILGNIGAILVFSRQRMQRNFHALMVALASFDLVYIIVNCFIFSFPQFFPNFNRSFLYCYLLPFVLPAAQVRKKMKFRFYSAG